MTKMNYNRLRYTIKKYKDNGDVDKGKSFPKINIIDYTKPIKQKKIIEKQYRITKDIKSGKFFILDIKSGEKIGCNGYGFTSAEKLINFVKTQKKFCDKFIF